MKRCDRNYYGHPIEEVFPKAGPTSLPASAFFALIELYFNSYEFK
jgi:hypothetical protein